MLWSSSSVLNNCEKKGFIIYIHVKCEVCWVLARPVSSNCQVLQCLGEHLAKHMALEFSKETVLKTGIEKSPIDQEPWRELYGWSCPQIVRFSLIGRTCLTRMSGAVLLSWNHEGSGLLKSLYIMWLLPSFAWANQFISKRSDVLELVDSLHLNIKRNTFTPLTSWWIVFKGQVYCPDSLECLLPYVFSYSEWPHRLTWARPAKWPLGRFVPQAQ
jgi:hypothetical protein